MSNSTLRDDQWEKIYLFLKNHPRVIFQEMPGWLFVIAPPIMVVGAVLFVNDEHEHAHTHSE